MNILQLSLVLLMQQGQDTNAFSSMNHRHRSAVRKTDAFTLHNNNNNKKNSPFRLFASTMDSSTTETQASFTTVAAVPKLSQRWRKSTKQVATLGPASSSKEMIETLFLAGADVFRLNFSHGSQEQKLELLNMIREVEDKYSHPIAALGDLQGPKLRVSFVIL